MSERYRVQTNRNPDGVEHFTVIDLVDGRSIIAICMDPIAAGTVVRALNRAQAPKSGLKFPVRDKIKACPYCRAVIAPGSRCQCRAG